MQLGFSPVQEGRRGEIQFVKRATPHLTIWVHHEPASATALVTFEHALGEYLDRLGLQVGSNEPLNQFLFPQRDSKGPADIEFVVNEIERIETLLSGVDLLDGRA